VKLHGGVQHANLKDGENIAAVRTGLANVRRHCENLNKFGVPVLICVNKFPTDTQAEIDLVLGETRQYYKIDSDNIDSNNIDKNNILQVEI
jgi:formate--tetrahydrofolate ligase